MPSSYNLEQHSDAKSSNVEINYDENDETKYSYSKSPEIVFSNTRFWRILRMVFKAFVLLIFISLLAFIIAIVIIHPRCKPTPKLGWWENALIYRINMEMIPKVEGENTTSRLKTLENNLDYFIDMKADVLWISDIIDLNKDFTTINENEFGSLDEFKSFIQLLHKNKMKVILDFIPNHTKNESAWFIQSANGDAYYRDFYIWSDTVPNNWQSIYNGSAWQPHKNSFYLHQFMPNEPDLNYRNQRVVDEFFNSIRFWLDVGIDGFNLLDVNYLYEDYLLRNETSQDQHEFTQNQPETFRLIAELKELVQKYAEANKTDDRILIADLNRHENKPNDTIIRKYYGSKSLGGFDMVLFERQFDTDNLNLMNSKTFIDIAKATIEKFGKYGKQPTWILDDNMLSDQSNGSILKDNYRMLQASIFALPGALVTNVQNHIYENFTKPNEDDILRRLGNLKSAKSIKFGDIKFQNSFSNCDFTEFSRYFDAQDSYGFLFALHNDACNYTSKQIVSTLIKGSSVDVSFISDSDTTPETIEFDSSGKGDFKLNDNAFVAVTWKYQPEDIKDIL